MRCKVGDLAVIVRAPQDAQHLGKVITIEGWDGFTEGWFYSPPLFTNGYEWRSIDDSALRPIRDPGDDAQDESLAWLPPVPHELPAPVAMEE